jgi:hypothetical protein
MNPWRWVDPRVAAVSLAAVRAYLGHQGWEERPAPGGSLLRFEKKAGRNVAPLVQMLPASEQLADFRQRVTELITTMSELEDRHPVAILDDMLNAGQRQPDGNGVGQNEPTASARK